MEALKARLATINATLTSLGLEAEAAPADRRRKAGWEAAVQAAEARLASAQAEAAKKVQAAVVPDRMGADRARILGAADAALLARIRATKGTLPAPVRVEVSAANRRQQADECAAILAADFVKDRVAAQQERRQPLTGRPFAALLQR